MTVDECFPETYCPRWFYIDSRARHRWTRGSEEVIITHVHSCILWTQLWYPCRGVTLLQTACLPGMCTYTMLLHIEQSHRRSSRTRSRSSGKLIMPRGGLGGPPKCWHRESRTRKRCHVRPKYFAQPFVFIISMCLKKFNTHTVIFNTRRVELVEVPSDGTVGNRIRNPPIFWAPRTRRVGDSQGLNTRPNRSWRAGETSGCICR